MSATHEHNTDTHQRPNYAAVFVALGILTLLEVAVSLLDDIPQAPFLIAMMITKAALVVAYYMHLKLDNKWYIAILFAPAPFAVLISVALIRA